MDAIDKVVLNSKLHFLGSDARVSEPRLKLAVLTCMDARIDVAALLGLRPGDAHVIRNAGGRATAGAVDAIAISQAVLGTREVMVIHHSDCAMGRLSEAELATKIKDASGHEPVGDLGCFVDPVAAVRSDVGKLRAAPSLAHRERIRGFMYDLAAGALTEIG